MSPRTPRIHRTPVCIAALLALGSLSAAAQAQSSDGQKAEAPKLQEVVITSQKRVERLKDTPVAAAVMSADALEKANAKIGRAHV